ncbi:MAG: carboxypeptidase regulatory-like domain-containing protein [candidate division NC10 bacterium]|nr:carboxypeptidase regulatory-like domain-containing protein [candidate division NC10 bacterium]
MKRFVIAVVALGMIGSLAGASDAYEAIKVDKGGTITGVVKFRGTPLVPEMIKITRDVEVCGKEPKFSEALLVSQKGGLKNAVISLVDIKQGKAWEAMDSPKLDQNGCRFIPHVLVLPAGVTFDLVNSDKILHNFHTTSAINPTLNKAQPKFKPVMKVDLKKENVLKPDLMKVNCDVHEWMNAWIIIADHPYYAVTDEDGSFTLKDVPPGTYTLQVWHETLGKHTKGVSVKEGTETKVSFELSR